MTQDQHKLEPCPWCGGEGVDVVETSTFRWRVAQCKHCGAQCGEVRVQTMGEGTREEWEAKAHADAIAAWNTRAHLQQRPLPVREEPDETPAEEALRSLACWLGVGGYNAPTVDAKVFEAKIREGVTTYLPLHGMAARNLAELVLDMGMVTDKGIRARELARRVLGIVPPAASPSLPVREEPTPEQIAAGVKAMRDNGWHLDTDELAQTMPLVYAAMMGVQNMGEGETGKDGVGGPLKGQQ